MRSPAHSRWTLQIGTAAAAAGMFALAGSVRAREGEFTPETRRKLEQPVTVEAGDAHLGDLMWEMAEQSGLSFAASAFVAKLPEPVAVVARDVPAGELVEAVAFAMRLDFHVTPGGVVSFRLEDDDPRREALLRRMFPPPREHRGAEGPPPRVDERKVAERVSDHPKVRALLGKLDAELVPAKFHPEKRVWVLLIRREGEEAPLGRVIATEEGEVKDIKIHRKKKKDRLPFELEPPGPGRPPEPKRREEF